MKLTLLMTGFLFSVAAMADETVACKFAGGDNQPLETITGQSDGEYNILESGTQQMVKFSLKAGHGVARLEASVRNRLIATSYYSTGREPAETDSLRLIVNGPQGEVEVQCYEIDSHLR